MNEQTASKRQIALIIILALVVVALLIWSVFFDSTPTVRTKEFYDYFDTITEVTSYTADGEYKFDRNCQKVEEKLKFYHELFDIYEEYAGVVNLATLNRMAGEGEVEVSRELFDFLEYALSLYKKTDGEMNIAMGAVLKIWHDYRKEGTRVPTLAELEAASAHTNTEDIILNREKLTVEITDPLLSLDVGAIAKGYAAERIAEMLAENGMDGYVLDLGGNLRVVGTKPDGSGWKTGIRNPVANSHIYTFILTDGSSVTSGDYMRYYTVDGVNYHHIIDKDTLFPANYFRSVTVITEDSGLADALSTALFCMDYESGLALVDSFEGVEVVWILHDGSLLHSN